MHLLLFLLSLPAFGQISLTPSGPATAAPGALINLNINIAGATSSGPTAAQWTLVLPPGYTVSSATLGAYATSVSKVLNCNPTRTLCLVFGQNVYLLGSGALAALSVQVPSNASGTGTFTLSGLFAANALGVSVPLSAGPAYSVAITGTPPPPPPSNISDVNRDGIVNFADVMAISGQITAGTCANDQNADGVCNLVDAMVVLRKVLGL